MVPDLKEYISLMEETDMKITIIQWFCEITNIFILQNSKNVLNLFRHLTTQPPHLNWVILENKSGSHKSFDPFLLFSSPPWY